MASSYRTWASRFVAELERKVALYERIGTGREGEAVILACLRDVIARHRAVLDAPIAPASVAEAPAPAAAVPMPAVRDPLAGTWRDTMLSSAGMMRGLGDEATALLFERHAASANPDGSRPADDVPTVRVDEAAQTRLAAIAPFSAGEQIGLFG